MNSFLIRSDLGVLWVLVTFKYDKCIHPVRVEWYFRQRKKEAMRLPFIISACIPVRLTSIDLPV